MLDRKDVDRVARKLRAAGTGKAKAGMAKVKVKSGTAVKPRAGRAATTTVEDRVARAKARLAAFLDRKGTKAKADGKDEKRKAALARVREIRAKRKAGAVSRKAPLKGRKAAPRQSWASRYKKAMDGDIAVTVEDADAGMDMGTVTKDYMNAPDGGNATPGTVSDAEVKKDTQTAIDLLDPTMLAEDVREAHAAAIRLAALKADRNLDGEHVLKDAMFHKMHEVGVHPRLVVAAIEAVFEEAGKAHVDALLARAAELMSYSPETLAEMTREAENTTIMVPVEVSEAEIAELVGEDAMGDDEGSEEELPEEVEDRMVEGSLRVPKGAGTGRDALADVMPAYVVPGQ